MEDIQYKQLLYTAPFGFAYHKIILNPAGEAVDYEFLEVNPTFEQLTGLKAADILNRPVTAVIPGLTREDFDRIGFYGEVALTGQAKEFEQYSAPLDRWYKVHVCSPQPHYFSTTFVDITQEKTQAAELEGFFAVNLDLLCIADLEGNFIKTNPAWSKTLGYSPAELNGHRFLDFVHPDDLQPTLAAMARLGEQEEVLNFVNRYRCQDGRYRFIEWRSHPQGKLIYAAARDITERKQVEDALRENRVLLNEMGQMANVGGWEVDIATMEQVWTEEVYRIHEVELTYQPTVAGGIDFYAPTSRPIIEQAVQRAIQYGEPFEVELEIITARGNWRWVQAKGKADLTRKKIFGTFQDITSRKQAEEEKRKVDASLRILSVAINQSPVTTVITDLAGNIVFVNPKFTQSTGYTAEEVIGQNPRILKTGNTSSAEYKVLWDTILSGQSWHGIFHNQKKNGELYWESAVISPVKDEEGKITHFLAVKEDITDRKQAEEALKQSEARYRAVAQSANDAIVSSDGQGNIMSWNRGAEAIFGYAEAEAMGLPLTLLMPTHFRDEHLGGMTRIQNNGEKHLIGKTVEVEGQRKDGSKFPLEISLAEWQVAEARYYTAIMRDITERKQAEAALLAANQEQTEMNDALERAIAIASSLTQKAELANIAKSEFLANMSHEIRTPMNGVIGMTGLLLDTRLDKEQQGYAEIVRASAESLLALINDILDFSKIEAGKLDLETLDFDLSTLLDDFAATMAGRASEKGLELLCAVAPGTPLLLQGDPGRLRQILTNLTGNALKFTHQGEVAIHVALREEGPTQCLVRFSVRDTGIGIPADKIDLLFDKFSQVDASTTRHYGGTGLGLAISKQLAELMGGEIGVISQAGHGAEFWFTVRLGKQPKLAPPQPLLPAALLGVRVLIVDDNATNREILTVRLEGWGMRPAEAPDGPTAMLALGRALAENDPFRLCLIDMQMPGMDGEALGRIIQADARLAGTPMVRLTSLGTRGEARDFARMGFAASASKPIRHLELFHILASVLNNAPVSATPPRGTFRSTQVGRQPFAGSQARILLAEDNITNQQVALGILRKLGLRAEAVASGAEALQVLATIPYDLVLMDVQMPEMDGLEATRRIRQSLSPTLNPHLPIIAMTAYAMPSDRERCLEAGMNDYVAKPVSPQLLAEVLTRWLSTPDEPAAEAAANPENPLSSPPPLLPVVFDHAELLDRMMDDEEMTQEILAVFLEELPRLIEGLQDYLDAGDRSGVQRQAHTIRGAAATVGGQALRALAFELEQAAQDGNLAAIKAGLNDLMAQFERLKAAILSITSKGDE